jgi:hypothetical protein
MPKFDLYPTPEAGFVDGEAEVPTEDAGLSGLGDTAGLVGEEALTGKGGLKEGGLVGDVEGAGSSSSSSNDGA